MPPEQSVDADEVQPKSEMNTEEEEDDDSSEDGEVSKSSFNSKSDKTRKTTHSEIERRRREKMNRYIDEIAQLLPIDVVKKLDKLTVLRVAVDTIKHLKGTSSKVSSHGFGRQIYLNDNELLELTLATIDQIGSYFFLIIECQKGRICYASNSIESILGYKRTELYLQSIFDITYPDDTEIIKQQLIIEKKTSSSSSEDSPNESKAVPLLTKQSSLEIGNRRTFSCRINSKTKQSNKTTTTTARKSPDNYNVIDFVGYIKQYSLTNDNSNEIRSRHDRRHTTLNTLTPSDVLNAIGTNPVSCLCAMGNIAPRIEKSNQQNENTFERMFICKLNLDGQFTYFDQICYPLLGYLSQDLIGMHLNDFIHEEDRTKLNEIWNRVCRDRQLITSGDYRFRLKSSRYINIQTIFEPFVNPWNDELEIIVARNRIKTKSVPVNTTRNNKNENPRSVDIRSPIILDSNELIRDLLP